MRLAVEGLASVAVALKDLGPSGDRYKGGTILDPEDGKVYKAEVWSEDGKLKVRGYLGLFYKTQTWVKQRPACRTAWGMTCDTCDR